MSMQLISDIFDHSSENNVRLFFIYREYGIEKGKHISNYYTMSVDIDDEIRKSLWELLNNTIKQSINGDEKFDDYVPVSDETQKRFKYSRKEKLKAFSKVLDKDLCELSSLPVFKGSVTQGKYLLWAYCIGFFDIKDRWVYSFSKITQRIQIDNKAPFKKIFASWGTDSAKLVKVKGEPFSLDKRIDTFYCNETFLIFSKKLFEDITSLKEEHQEIAKEEIGRISERGFIKGLETIGDQIIDSSRLVTKLIYLHQDEKFQNVDPQIVINNIKETASRLSIPLNFEEEKVVVRDRKELHIVIKILTDYYKEGTYSHQIYGTSAGKPVDPSSDSE